MRIMDINNSLVRTGGKGTAYLRSARDMRGANEFGSILKTIAAFTRYFGHYCIFKGEIILFVVSLRNVSELAQKRMKQWELV